MTKNLSRIQLSIATGYRVFLQYWNTGRFRRDYLWTERHNTKDFIEIQTPFIIILNSWPFHKNHLHTRANIEQNTILIISSLTLLITPNIVHTTTCSRLSLNSHPLNELAISPFIHLASKNRPMCMRSKNKECFKKTTHSHYSLT